VPFTVKLSLFAAVGLLSIYPTRQVLSWCQPLKHGVAPRFDPERLRTVRRIVHLELIAPVVLILCAALIARGIGYVGA
jgi:putative membrane protein